LYWLYEYYGISGLYPRVWETEMGLTRVLCDMEEAGLAIDVDYLETLRDSLTGVSRALELQISDLLPRRGEPNLGSDDWLRDLLQRDLGFRLTKTTKKHQLSVDREVLESFEKSHPIIPLIMEWRDAEKLINTYTTSILSRLDSNSILHANFQQVMANTGRMACREPNFQNQPSDDDKRARRWTGKSLEDGGIDPWSIRRAYKNRGKGWVRLFFDYSQIELRVLAFYSRDPSMVDAYLNGEDIHARTSLEVFGTKEKAKRRFAKIINFGLSYGMSEIGFSRQAKIPLPEAEAYLKKFFQRYQGITEFKRQFYSQVRSQGCAFQNLFGRPRRLPDMNSPNSYNQGRAERQAIATLIQGTAAELMKEALVSIYCLFKEAGYGSRLVNVVHDEVQADVPVEELASVSRDMKMCMEAFPEFSPIPIIADGEWTDLSWADKRRLPI
jgi:DNA polymerase-1